MDNKNLVEEALSAALDLHDNFDDNKSRVITLLQQALLPTPRFYVGQPVLVSDDGENWHRARLENIRGERFIYECDDGAAYPYCKPDLSASSSINWIEHDGRGTPMFGMGDIIVVQYRNGESECTNDDARELGGRWRHKDRPSDIIRYCVVPLARFIDQAVFLGKADASN